MKYASLNNQRVLPTKGGKGKCPHCGSDLIAKCGDVNRHHWSHKTRKCDDHWWENETDWHRDWKNCFPEEWQEVIHFDEVTGEKHIADVKTSEGWVVEFQHSLLKNDERDSRNNFYKKIVWVVNGARRKNDIKHFKNVMDSHDLILKNPPIISPHPRVNVKLFDEWCSPNVAVLFDYQIVNNKGEQMLWLLFPATTDGKRYLSPISQQGFVEKVKKGFETLFNEVINPVVEEMDRRHRLSEQQKKQNSHPNALPRMKRGGRL